MIFDIHTHIGGFLGGNTFRPGNFKRLRTKLFMKAFGVDPERLDPDLSIDQDISDKYLQYLSESSVDKAVVLALDHAYTVDGTLHPGTRYSVDKDYVLSVVQRSDKALYGCSIHPYRKDALDALESAVNSGATLVKWIPSTQNIDPASKQCIPFYELLKFYGLPLLSHTGYEHTVNTFSQQLNVPNRLETVLKHGVTVIAAHCGANLFPHERNYFRQWVEMTSRFENLYGDISAFALPLRYLPMKSIMKSEHLASRILYGSDYPAFAWPSTYLPTLGIRKVRQLSRIENPIQRTLETMQSLTIEEAVFTRAETVLRLPSQPTL